jgi:hypothetical protein
MDFPRHLGFAVLARKNSALPAKPLDLLGGVWGDDLVLACPPLVHYTTINLGASQQGFVEEKSCR